MRSILPVLTVLAIIVAIWQLAVAPMNIRTALDMAERDGAALNAARPPSGKSRSGAGARAILKTIGIASLLISLLAVGIAIAAGSAGTASDGWEA